MWRSSMTPGVAQMPKGMCLRPESARSLLHAERFARKALSPMDTAITNRVQLRAGRQRAAV